MKKGSIIQFSGFITQLDYEEFAVKWEHFARQLAAGTDSMVLQQDTDTKSRFKYVSRHIFQQQDFSFSLLNEKKTGHLTDHKTRWVGLGGYTPAETSCRRPAEKNETRVLAFLHHDEYDMDFYRRLNSSLTIYQAYYESCVYGHIIEFHTDHLAAPELVQQVKSRAGTDVSIYKECRQPKLKGLPV